MASDFSVHIKQLTAAKEGCVASIAALEKASDTDGADRSISLALLRRDLGSYENQLAKMAPEPKTNQLTK